MSALWFRKCVPREKHMPRAYVQEFYYIQNTQRRKLDERS